MRGPRTRPAQLEPLLSVASKQVRYPCEGAIGSSADERILDVSIDRIDNARLKSTRRRDDLENVSKPLWQREVLG